MNRPKFTGRVRGRVVLRVNACRDEQTRTCRRRDSSEMCHMSLGVRPRPNFRRIGRARKVIVVSILLDEAGSTKTCSRIARSKSTP